MSKLQFVFHEPEKVKKFFSSYATNPRHPFFGYEGNNAAVETGLDILYSAFMEKDYLPDKTPYCTRLCPARIALIAPMSSGKTEYYRRFVKVLGTPYLEIDGTKLSSAEEIHQLCFQTWKANPEVVEYKYKEWQEVKTVTGAKRYVAPPMSILIDEFGRVKPAVQDGLLKMCEKKDGILVADGIEYDYRGVCIFIATNNPGKIRPAFKSRFTTITLERPDIAALTKIINNENKDWAIPDCFRVAKLCPVARQALDFCRLVEDARKRNGGTIFDTIELVRKRHGFYNVGLNRRAISVLQALENSLKGLSRASLLATMDNMEEEEFDSDILPQLIPGGGRAPLISISNRHQITEEGKAALVSCGEENLAEAA